MFLSPHVCLSVGGDADLYYTCLLLFQGRRRLETQWQLLFGRFFFQQPGPTSPVHQRRVKEEERWNIWKKRDILAFGSKCIKQQVHNGPFGRYEMRQCQQSSGFALISLPRKFIICLSVPNTRTGFFKRINYDFFFCQSHLCLNFCNLCLAFLIDRQGLQTSQTITCALEYSFSILRFEKNHILLHIQFENHTGTFEDQLS